MLRKPRNNWNFNGKRIKGFKKLTKKKHIYIYIDRQKVPVLLEWSDNV